MNEARFCKELQRIIDRDFGGNQSEAARAWGISRFNLNPILRGRVKPYRKVAEAAGFKMIRTTTFVRA